MGKQDKKTELTYYSGFLECQFSDVKKNQIVKNNRDSKIVLEPRFKLFDAELVEENPFDFSKIKNNQSYIYQYGSLFPIEFYYKKKQSKKNEVNVANKILLILKSDDLDKDYSNTVEFNKILNENKKNENSGSFISDSIENQHGKISGKCFVAVLKEYDIYGNEIDYAVLPDGTVDRIFKYPNNPGGINSNKGCFPFSKILSTITKKIFYFNSLIKDWINQYSNRIFKKPLLTDESNKEGTEGSGCLGSMLPSGCTNNGCLQLGCGCLSLMLALLLLLWLIWCVLLGKCDQDQKNNQQRIIHDTVYIEVNKTKIDTIIKKDTIIYEDKTTKSKVSVVQLKNVQFEHDKAILLKSSEASLNELVDHLKEHKNVKAHFIGHTDNVGDKKRNFTLSKERAEAVRQYLIERGIEANRLTSEGKGDTEPVASNDNPEDRALNRRVEVRLTNTESSTEETKRTKKQ